MAIHSFNRLGEVFTVNVDTKAKSITVTRADHQPRSFNIGDQAIYDSWNLYYTGSITNITDKTVTFKRPGYDQRKRITITEFAWRNYDFDAQRIAEENAETMQYL